MAKTLFVTGTGTDVGKTFVTGLILKKWKEAGANAAYFKAAISGNDRRPDGTLIPGDAVHVKSVSGIPQPLEEMCPYVYETAVSPHLAAKLEGAPIQLDRVLTKFDSLCARYDTVTMEGSGGILCPLRFDGTSIQLTDLIRARDLPCLLVADAGLGTINSVGLTAAYMESHGFPLQGIIFNHFRPGDILHEDNWRMCEAITGKPVVACVKDGDTDLDLSLDVLASFYK